MILGDGAIKQARTQGFNPYYQSKEDITFGIEQELLPSVSYAPVDAIYFYGAGCSTIERKSVISEAMRQFFPEADIQVHNDLLGAARAVCLHDPGIACILGTGSGSCLFNGIDIIKNIPSLGFILGDEGSGAYLGKKMISDFLRNNMTVEIEALFKEAFKTDKETVLEQVNKKPMPSRYLAGFARFIAENKNLAYFHQLLYKSFQDFAENYILRYTEYHQLPVHFVGSIAYFNHDILRNLSKDLGFVIGNIIENPIAGLTLYHTENK